LFTEVISVAKGIAFPDYTRIAKFRLVTGGKEEKGVE